ncbi:HlyD family secretion protein [Frateuria defendens]|uniref:HlyD family secretion protein n=1 Tax=Frateuria defendens TaxID=2219559 RepID=UPI001929D451|nr:HlyD family secretion protein [Frateuria defendens]
MWIAVRVAVLVLALALLWLFANRWNAWVGLAAHQSTDDAYLESDVTPLSAHVPGYVRRVLVDDFQRVHRGQLLVELEDGDYGAQAAQAQAALDQNRATLEVLARQVDQQQANIAASRAGVSAATASADLSQREAQRQRDLFQGGYYASRQAVDQAESGSRQAGALRSQQAAGLLATQRQLDTLRAQQGAAAAAVEQQQAALALARINLGYTRIVAPENGMVGLRQVRAGQYVAAGTQLLSLVALPRAWVVANYKETQMTRVRAGQPAEVHVDAFPDLVLHGHVESWSPASGSRFALLPPDNATGNFTKVVQRFGVKILLDPASPAQQALLRPGMSVVATIDTRAGR